MPSTAERLMWLVIIERPTLMPYRQKYALFTEELEALRYAKTFGWQENPFGKAPNKARNVPGIKNTYACGEVMVSVMPVLPDDSEISVPS